MKMNQLHKNQQRNKISIKDIDEFTLQNKEMMKLLIMEDIRSCTNVIIKHIEIREEVEEHFRLMISWVQILTLTVDLNINIQKQDKRDMIINNQQEKNLGLIIKSLFIFQNIMKVKVIIEMEADSMEDKAKRYSTMMMDRTSFTLEDTLITIKIEMDSQKSSMEEIVKAIEHIHITTRKQSYLMRVLPEDIHNQLITKIHILETRRKNNIMLIEKMLQ